MTLQANMDLYNKNNTVCLFLSICVFWETDLSITAWNTEVCDVKTLQWSFKTINTLYFMTS